MGSDSNQWKNLRCSNENDRKNYTESRDPTQKHQPPSGFASSLMTCQQHHLQPITHEAAEPHPPPSSLCCSREPMLLSSTSLSVQERRLGPEETGQQLKQQLHQDVQEEQRFTPEKATSESQYWNSGNLTQSNGTEGDGTKNFFQLDNHKEKTNGERRNCQIHGRSPETSNTMGSTIWGTHGSSINRGVGAGGGSQAPPLAKRPRRTVGVVEPIRITPNIQVPSSTGQGLHADEQGSSEKLTLDEEHEAKISRSKTWNIPREELSPLSIKTNSSHSTMTAEKLASPQQQHQQQHHVVYGRNFFSRVGNNELCNEIYQLYTQHGPQRDTMIKERKESLLPRRERGERKRSRSGSIRTRTRRERHALSTTTTATTTTTTTTTRTATTLSNEDNVNSREGESLTDGYRITKKLPLYFKRALLRSRGTESQHGENSLKKMGHLESLEEETELSGEDSNSYLTEASTQMRNDNSLKTSSRANYGGAGSLQSRDQISQKSKATRFLPDEQSQAVETRSGRSSSSSSSSELLAWSSEEEPSTEDEQGEEKDQHRATAHYPNRAQRQEAIEFDVQHIQDDEVPRPRGHESSNLRRGKHSIHGPSSSSFYSSSSSSTINSGANLNVSTGQHHGIGRGRRGEGEERTIFNNSGDEMETDGAKEDKHHQATTRGADEALQFHWTNRDVNAKGSQGKIEPANVGKYSNRIPNNSDRDEARSNTNRLQLQRPEANGATPTPPQPKHQLPRQQQPHLYPHPHHQTQQQQQPHRVDRRGKTTQPPSPSSQKSTTTSASTSTACQVTSQTQRNLRHNVTHHQAQETERERENGGREISAETGEIQDSLRIGHQSLMETREPSPTLNSSSIICTSSPSGRGSPRGSTPFLSSLSDGNTKAQSVWPKQEGATMASGYPQGVFSTTLNTTRRMRRRNGTQHTKKKKKGLPGKSPKDSSSCTQNAINGRSDINHERRSGVDEFTNKSISTRTLSATNFAHGDREQEFYHPTQQRPHAQQNIPREHRSRDTINELHVQREISPFSPDPVENELVVKDGAVLKLRPLSQLASREQTQNPTDADPNIRSSRDNVVVSPDLRTSFTHGSDVKWLYCASSGCSFWTRKPDRMLRHTQCHVPDARYYRCPDCSSKFYSLAKLLKHDRKVHTGIKDYECRVCEAEVTDIIVHMKVSTNYWTPISRIPFSSLGEHFSTRGVARWTRRIKLRARGCWLLGMQQYLLTRGSHILDALRERIHKGLKLWRSVTLAC